NFVFWNKISRIYYHFINMDAASIFHDPASLPQVATRFPRSFAMSMSSVSIGKKLIIAFATLTTVILLTGVFGFSQLATLEDASYELRDNRIPSLKIIAEASNVIQNHRIAVSRLVVDDDP